jgi:hypothetical protein
MRLIFYILSLCITISFHAQNCCEFEFVKGKPIERISDEYKLLKVSVDKECCRNYGSGLMKIMEVLSDSIELNTNEERIIKIMGMPDTYASDEHPIEHHFTQLGKNEKILIYYWRGLHDFLYFVLLSNLLVSKHWYYALD